MPAGGVSSGGYLLVTAGELKRFAAALRGPLRGDHSATRLWLALLEVRHRATFETDGPDEEELLRQAVRLARFSKPRIGTAATEHLREAGFLVQERELSGDKRRLPRRALKHLVRFGTLSATVAWLHACWYLPTKGGYFRARHAARVWGLDRARISQGRTALVSLGILVRHAWTPGQVAKRGWGGYQDLEWVAPAGRARHQRPTGITRNTRAETGATPGRESGAPLRTPAFRAPAKEHPDRLAPARSAALQAGGKAKAGKAGRTAARRLHVEQGDLSTPGGRQQLWERARCSSDVASIWKSEAGCLALHALTIQVIEREGVRNPRAVVARALRGDAFPLLTQTDEDAGRRSRTQALGHHVEAPAEFVPAARDMPGAYEAPEVPPAVQIRREAEARAQEDSARRAAERAHRCAELLRRQAEAEAACAAGLPPADDAARVAAAFARPTRAPAGAAEAPARTALHRPTRGRRPAWLERTSPRGAGRAAE